MLAIAALKIGLRCHVYAPETEAPAHDAAHARTVAAYEDEAALRRFADACDLVTFEFENVPDSTAAFLAERRPTRPAPRILGICQERLREKDFLASIQVPTTRYRRVAAAARALRASR